MLLLEHPLSSYAQKVKIALREKGVPFRAELPEDFGTGRADTPFVRANPRAEVPVLIDGDVRVFESTVILEYIEERWPDPPLLPRDPAGRRLHSPAHQHQIAGGEGDDMQPRFGQQGSELAVKQICMRSLEGNSARYTS